MEYDKLTKQELVKILEDIRSPRFTCGETDEGELLRLLEALLLERHELQSQIEKLKDSITAVEDSLSEYIDLFETAPVGYVMLDAGGCLLKMNHSARVLVGREPRVLMGLPFWGVLTEESRFLFLRHFTECRRLQRQVKSVALHLATKESVTGIIMTGCCTNTYRGLLLPNTQLPQLS
jgi:PAS domain-containing protein